MISLLDIAERAQKGPKMDEKEWDLSLFRNAARLAEKYGIKYPGDGSYFNLDDDVAARAYEAALEFLVEYGIYCISTGRRITFDRGELEATIGLIPSSIIVGCDRDQRVISQKKVEGGEPLNQCAGHHAPWSEEYAPLVVKNFAQVTTGDYLEGFNFAVVDGREIFSMPMEVYAARRELSWLREGIRKAGRPGMALAYYPINTRAATLIAPMDPNYGLRPTDGILLSTLPGIKVEQDLLAAAIVYEDYGSFKVNGGSGAWIGGFCGGAEGAIIEGLVKGLGGFLVYRDTLCNTGVGHSDVTTTKVMRARPEQCWAESVLMAAFNNHTNTICFGGGGHSSGPGTETHLLELAYSAGQNAINGANHYIPRQSRARMNASQTPLEAEWMKEVEAGFLKAGIDRAAGNKVMARLAESYEGRAVEAPVPTDECYDLVRHKPKAGYQAVYEKCRDILKGCGVPLD